MRSSQLGCRFADIGLSLPAARPERRQRTRRCRVWVVGRVMAAWLQRLLKRLRVAVHPKPWRFVTSLDDTSCPEGVEAHGDRRRADLQSASGDFGKVWRRGIISYNKPATPNLVLASGSGRRGTDGHIFGRDFSSHRCRVLGQCMRWGLTARRTRDDHTISRIKRRDCRNSSCSRRRSSMALRVYNPCFSAFVLPRGAPVPGAPPCIQHRFFPRTGAARQGLPDLVFAPHRRGSAEARSGGRSAVIFSPAR